MRARGRLAILMLPVLAACGANEVEDAGAPTPTAAAALATAETVDATPSPQTISSAAPVAVVPAGMPPNPPARYVATVESGPATVRLYRFDSPSWHELPSTGDTLPAGGCPTGTIYAGVSTDRIVAALRVRTLANRADGPVGVIQAFWFGDPTDRANVSMVWVFLAQVPPGATVSVAMPHGGDVAAIVQEDIAVAVAPASSLDIDHLPRPVTVTIDDSVYTTSPAQGAVMLLPIHTHDRPGCYPLYESPHGL